MFKKNKLDRSMLVEEPQYRGVITFDSNKRTWKASVQRRIDVSEWKRVQCGLKGVPFKTKEAAESAARWKIKEQRALDNQGSNSVSYVIYDD
jgi:hypothetical protein